MINTLEQLTSLIEEVRHAEWIALDTEADSLHAYPEKLCLLQLTLPSGNVLVDPLAGCDMAPLMEVLRTKPLTLHGADYDLRLLTRAYGFVPQSIFDTMWAARLLGYREFGLSVLVQQHLGIELEKGPQKMNWAVRPLTPRMEAYALNDTRFLQPLATLLRERLKACGRLTWLQEVCAKVIQDCTTPRERNTEDLWRIKGSDRLDPPALAILRVLWDWREVEAVQANRPPYFVLSHETLVALSTAIARGRPTAPLIPPRIHPKRAARLAAAVQRAMQVPASDFPQRRRSTGVRLTSDEQTRLDSLKRVRDQQAEQIGLDPTLIASKNDLVALARDGQRARNQLMSWQRELLPS